MNYFDAISIRECSKNGMYILELCEKEKDVTVVEKRI